MNYREPNSKVTRETDKRSSANQPQRGERGDRKERRGERQERTEEIGEWRKLTLAFARQALSMPDVAYSLQRSHHRNENKAVVEKQLKTMFPQTITHRA